MKLLQRVERVFRDPNPILVKELRATFRTKLFIRFLSLSTGLVAILVLSVGAAVATGLDILRREPHAAVVVIGCDTGSRYLSEPHRWRSR